MTHNGSMLGLWIVRDRDGQTLLARVQGEDYVLAFGSAVRASKARESLGAEGTPFLIVAANVRDIVESARGAGALGFIVDYDAERACFASAHSLPVTTAPAAAAR
jgi:hypothetical protein